MTTRVEIGLLGLGVVGTGVVQALMERADLIAARCGRPVSIKRALVRDAARPRPLAVPAGLLTADPEDVLADPDISIVVEVLGGEYPAYEFARRALLAGKHLVTANKEMLAKHGRELVVLAGERGLEVGFEASVGGGIPIIAALRRCLVANRIAAVRGIVNGTTNYILTEMDEKGRDFALALREAQELGYAEPDPTNDVEGYDSRYKLVILCALAFGAWPRPEAIPCEGITGLAPVDFRLARDLGCAIKLLAVGRQSADGLEARVQPTLVRADGMLASVKGVFNAVQVEGDMVGDMVFYGRGAGPAPTASAVLADIVGIARGEGSPLPVGAPEARVVPPGEVAGRFYVRLEVADGSAADAAVERFTRLGIDIVAVRLVEEDLALVTGVARRGAVERAAAEVAASPPLKRVVTLLYVVE